MSTNYDHPFAFDMIFMIEHINELIAKRPVDIPIYDYTQHTSQWKDLSGTTVDMSSLLKGFTLRINVYWWISSFL